MNIKSPFYEIWGGLLITSQAIARTMNMLIFPSPLRGILFNSKSEGVMVWQISQAVLGVGLWF